MTESVQGNHPTIESFPHGNRWHYFGAKLVNEKIAKAGEDMPAVAKILGDFVFTTHPHVSDYVPALTHRFNQALAVAESFTGGEDEFAEVVLDRFWAVEQRLQEGYTYSPTSVVIRFDNDLPQPVCVDGESMQKIYLPESVQRKSLVWNRWAQTMVKNVSLKQLFREHPFNLGLKPADGLLLPVGNLVIEVTEGLGRIRGDTRFAGALESALGLETNPDGVGENLDQWFVMTHIMEKDMLDLAATIGADMIDSRSLTPEVYAKSYFPIMQIMDLNPQLPIKGVLSDGTWIYSSELGRLFPGQHIAKLHDIAGRVVNLGPAEEIGKPEQVGFATHDPVRRQAYEQGQYSVSVVARFIDREGMEAAIRRYGLVA